MPKHIKRQRVEQVLMPGFRFVEKGSMIMRMLMMMPVMHHAFARERQEKRERPKNHSIACLARKYSFLLLHRHGMWMFVCGRERMEKR